MLSFLGPFAPKSNGDLARLGVLLALAALIIFGALRYDNFLSQYNILSFLRYNSMFALIALGMAFVIMTGGIDLSVGGTLLTGGKANIFGTIVGAFVIQLMQYTLLANGVPDAAARVVKAALIILAVFIQQRANKA